MANEPTSGQPAAPAAAPSQPAPKGDLVLKSPAENPRAQGHSPARDQRRNTAAQADPNQPPPTQQQPGQQQPEKIRVGDAEYAADQVSAAMAERAEREINARSLPQDFTGYKAELPPDFKAPNGIGFEVDERNPAFDMARQFAAKHQLPQSAFSDLMGIYAAEKTGELARTTIARDAELAKLGAAAPQRMDAIETWLAAKVGNKAAPLMNALKAYPVASTVEALEGVIQAFTNQGGSVFTQSHREGAPEAGKIPGFESMNFMQQRIAQMNLAAGRKA